MLFIVSSISSKTDGSAYGESAGGAYTRPKTTGILENGLDILIQMVSLIPKSKTFTKFTMDSWTKMATPPDARLVVCLLLIRSLNPGIIISSNLPSLVSVKNTI